MNFKANETQQKLSGAYYTPEIIANFITTWTLKEGCSRILEPSCGDGAFFKSIAKTQKDTKGIHILGIDIDSEACTHAKRMKKKIEPGKLEILNKNFLESSIKLLNQNQEFDAVLGNPPFVRYQYLHNEDQELTEYIFDSADLKFTKHTNAWVPFVLQSLRLLKPGGRLGMVVPAELLHVLHAKSLRNYLTQQCKKIISLHVTDLFSKEVLQGVTLLLCEKKKADETIKIAFPHAGIDDLENGNAQNLLHNIQFSEARDLEHKWMIGLLDEEERTIFKKALANKNIKQFTDIASVDVGIVTGANKFFLVPESTVQKYNLKPYAYKMFGRSSQVKGLIYSNDDHQKNTEEGQPTYFLNFPALPKDKFPSKIQEYLLLGEEQELHTRYKCRIRTPWYCVPSVWSSQISMLKRCHIIPRVIWNEADAYTTDTAYRIQPVRTDISPQQLAFSFINSLTALCAELEGRHYGGGVLELVPSEIERLSIPITTFNTEELQKSDADFRSGVTPLHVLKRHDKILLNDAGLSENEILTIQKAHAKLLKRRLRN